MNYITTIVLVVMLLVVGAFFWLVDFDAAPRDAGNSQPAGRGEPLFTADMLPTEQVTTVTIERDGQKIVLAKEGRNWVQTEPVRFALNTFGGRDFVDAAAQLRYTAKQTPGENHFPSLDEARLNPANVTITLSIGGDKPTVQTIRLGRTVGASGYLMLNDEKEIYFVNGNLHDMAAGKPGDWRRKSLDMPSESAAQRIAITTAGGALNLIKDEGAWALQSPHSGRVDREAVKSLLDGVGAISIDSFTVDAPPDLSIYGLTAPTAELSVTMSSDDVTTDDDGKSPNVRTLAIGRPVDLTEEKFYATILENGEPTGVVFTLFKRDTQKLATTADKLRDPRIVLAAAADVSQMKLERADGLAITLDRGSSGWTFAEPGPGFAADHDAVASLIESVVRTKADHFTADVIRDDVPAARLTLAAIGRSEPEVMRIFKTDDGSAMVLRNNETTGYHVTGDGLSGLFAPLLTLRDRNLLNIPADKLAAITIEQPGGSVYAFSREKLEENAASAALGAWTLDGADRFEEPALQQLLAALLPLRAVAWIEQAAEPSVGYTLSLTTAQGDVHRITIDPATRTAHALTLADRPFEVGEELLTRLGAEFRDRTVIALDADAISSVQLNDGHQTATIIRDGPRYVDTDGATIDAQAAAGLFDALSGLRVQRFLAQVAQDESRQGLCAIAITTRDDRTISLTLDAANHRAFIDGADEWFALEGETVEKLTAPLAGQ